MKNLVVVYESRYGHSQKIADRIAEIARRRDYHPQILHAQNATAEDLMGASAVFVVAPVYLSRHPKPIEAFVSANAATLSAMPSALFSVSASAADPGPDARAALEAIDQAFLSRTRWQPRHVVRVAGALSWPRYGFFVRMMMKAIVRRKGVTNPDMTRIHELTDWAALDAATSGVLDAVERPTTKVAPRPAPSMVV